MATADVYDVVLFGFRNDLARARTLDFVDRLPPAEAGPATLDPESAQPQRLFVALDVVRAQQLRAELEQLGAQVALLPAGTPPETVRPAVACVPIPRPRLRLQSFIPLLLAVLGATAYVWHAAARSSLPPAPLAVHASRRPLEAMPAQLRSDADGANDLAAIRLNATAIQQAEARAFGEAVDTLQAALRLRPNQPVLTRNLQTVLLNWGVTDLNADRLDDALAHLRQATQLGRRPEVLTALGVTYLRQADYARAAGTLRQALTLAPADANVLLGLAEAYLRQDERARALAFLQRARDAGARGPGLDQLLQQLGREVDAEWGFVQLESRHFRVRFADDDDRSAVRQVLDALEDAYDAVGNKFDYYPSDKTEVVLYTQQDFHEVTQTPDWAGAAFDGRIKLPVRGLTADDPNLERILRHEYAHSLVARLAGTACPVWLNEGLAVWAAEDDDDARTRWAEAKIANQPLFTLDDLRGSFVHLPRDRVEVAYAESYLAVQGLLDRYGTDALLALVRDLRTQSLGAAFKREYAYDFADFQQQLLRDLNG